MGTLNRLGVIALVCGLTLAIGAFLRLQRQARIELGMDGPQVIRTAGRPDEVFDPGDFGYRSDDSALTCDGHLEGKAAQLFYQNWLFPSLLVELGQDGRVVARCKGWMGTF